MFRLQAVAMLEELQCSKTHTALLCDLSIVNGEVYKLMSLCYYVTIYNNIIKIALKV